VAVTIPITFTVTISDRDLLIHAVTESVEESAPTELDWLFAGIEDAIVQAVTAQDNEPRGIFHDDRFVGHVTVIPPAIQFPDDADLVVLKLAPWDRRESMFDDRAAIREWDGQTCELIEEWTDDTGEPHLVLLLTHDGVVITADLDEIHTVETDEEDH